MNGILNTLFLVFISFICISCNSDAQTWEEETLLLMGSKFQLVANHPKKIIAKKAIQNGIDEIQRIEKLISSWDSTSQTSKINRNAGIKPVIVDKELFDLIFRTKKISELTNGAFDISYASIDKIWKFDGSMTQMPDSFSVANSVRKINYQRIQLSKENASVFLLDKGMKIGFGAIGKGYAANKAKKIMIDLGIENGMVNAGGDLIAWGKGPNLKNWDIKIADPKKIKPYIATIDIINNAVVTSGNYEKFVVFNNHRYAHIINPKTGFPVKGIKSVTVLCPDAELADALATSIFVLGVDKGLDLINQLKAIECMIITDQDEILYSKTLDFKEQ